MIEIDGIKYYRHDRNGIWMFMRPPHHDFPDMKPHESEVYYNDLGPEMLDEIERLRAENALLKVELQAHCEHC